MKYVRGILSLCTSFAVTQVFVLGLAARLSVAEIALAWLSVGLLVSVWCTSNLVRVVSDPRLRRLLEKPYLDNISDKEVARVTTICWVAYAPVVVVLWPAFLVDAGIYAWWRVRQ